MKNINQQETLDFAKNLAIKAGKLLMDYRFGSEKLEIIDKKEQGIATNADIAAEKFILDEIKNSFPDHQILSEEHAYGSDINNAWPLKNYQWMIDPLDGTSNYYNGIAFYSVSIALAGPEGMLLGVVYNPELNKMYYGDRNGSFIEYKNEIQPLKRGDDCRKLSECLFSPFLGASKGLLTTNDYMNLVKIKNECRAFRRLGSAALEIAMVASSELDAYWEKGLSPWDIAAAYTICQNAGLEVTEINGAVLSPFSKTILCAPKKHHDYLTQVLTGQS